MLEVIQVLEKNDLEHMENIWKKCILLTMIEKTQDKQLRLCNFEPPSPSKVQCARNTKQTHKTLSPINSIYIYLLPDIGSFLKVYRLPAKYDEQNQNKQFQPKYHILNEKMGGGGGGLVFSTDPKCLWEILQMTALYWTLYSCQ